MICPACQGNGGEIEIITDDGQGPWYECGFCKGTGKISRILHPRIYHWAVSAYEQDKKLKKDFFKTGGGRNGKDN